MDMSPYRMELKAIQDAAFVPFTDELAPDFAPDFRLRIGDLWKT